MNGSFYFALILLSNYEIQKVFIYHGYQVPCILSYRHIYIPNVYKYKHCTVLHCYVPMFTEHNVTGSGMLQHVKTLPVSVA